MQKEVREEEITADLIFLARGDMQPDKATGAEDIVVTEMLKELLIESIFENTKWFQSRCRRECDAPPSWEIVQLVFLRKPDASAPTSNILSSKK